jgi:dextranase
MKQLPLSITFIVLVLLAASYGESALATNNTLDVVPNKAFYRPGEPVTLYVTANGGTQVEVTITYLAGTVDQVQADLVNGTADLTWTPPTDSPRGYGVDARLLDGSGNVLATASTAFDVLDRWTQAPRYGFLSEFSPGRNDAEATMAWAARYHLNGLQFYDWQYRHETLLPPEGRDPYTDLLGRELSLETVNALIEAAHARNIAAMPYTAIYGASVAFYQQHPDWALFQRRDHPYEFGGNFLVIMDPTPGSPWADHLLGEFARVLDETAFDGIHIDQYGAPKNGLNAAGDRVDLADVFPAFIDAAAEVVQERRGDEGAVIFNAVGNWPVDTVAPSNQDAVYIEVWQPYIVYMDLHRLVVEAERLGGGKPVIIAAYIHPDRVGSVRLANAIIFASGGVHLELGEPGAMLADPYFPRFGRMDTAMQALMRHHYDFLVRYENVLALDTTDATAARAAALTITDVPTEGRQSYNRVAVIVRAGENTETFSLVNLIDIDKPRWDRELEIGPTPQSNLNVRIAVERPVARVWWASPDGESIAPQAVDFTTDSDGSAIAFTLPSLAYWDMIVLEYQP